MNRKIEEPLREAITHIEKIEEILGPKLGDEATWYIVEALKRIQDALDES